MSNIETVEINGVKYTVTPDMKEALEKQQEEAKKREDTLQTTIKENTKAIEDLKTAAQKRDEGLDYRGGKKADDDNNNNEDDDVADLLFTDPGKAVEKITNKIETKLRSEYQQEKQTVKRS